MILVNHRIAESIVFIAVFQHSVLQLGPFLQAQPFGQGSGGDVADDNLQGNNGNLFNDGLPLVDFLDEMGGFPIGLSRS